MADYKEVYQTEAVNTGGRDGLSYLTDGSYEVKIATPKSMGGSGNGQNPEQLFALGYSACFHSALEVVKAQHKINNASQVTHNVRLYKKPDAPDFQLEVDIAVGIEDYDLDKTKVIAQEAHKVCPYSKAVAGNIAVTIRAVDYDESKTK